MVSHLLALFADRGVLFLTMVLLIVNMVLLTPQKYTTALMGFWTVDFGLEVPFCKQINIAALDLI